MCVMGPSRSSRLKLIVAMVPLGASSGVVKVNHCSRFERGSNHKTEKRKLVDMLELCPTSQ